MDTRKPTQKREIKFKSYIKNPDGSIEVHIYRPFDDNDDGGNDLVKAGCKILDYGLQFTGLHDKNGKGIYEGDIVRSSEYAGTTGVVEFINDIFDAYGENKPLPVSGFYITSNKWDYPLEDFVGWVVIGNIFENPELLS